MERIDTNRKSVVHPVKAVPMRINVVNRNVCAQQAHKHVVRDCMVQFPDI